MGEPARDHIAESDQTAPAGRQIKRHVKAIAAPPVAFCAELVEQVDFGSRQ